MSRDELLARAVGVFEREGAASIQLFGSLARGEGDALSDIDLWITIPDGKIEAVTERRFEIYSDIAEVVIDHEAPRNRPVGGAYSLVIHQTGDALIQADYYLAPESTSVARPGARHLSGARLPHRGEWILDIHASAIENRRERINFLICMSFIGVKKALRGDCDFPSFLRREYEHFRTTYDASLDPINLTGELDSLARLLRSLHRHADELQTTAIRAVLNDIPRQARRYAESGDAPA